LFEITDLFDMHLRPELILLQKTMVSVEGVARRLNPDHDLWAAAQPVVAAWIRRELGPQAQVRDLFDEGRAVIRALSRQAQNPPAPPPGTVVVERRLAPWATVAAGLGFVAGTSALVMTLWPRMFGG
jgi:ubiquinone biosynthesis protein